VNPVVHFEMPAEDAKRVSEFYSKVFGWKNELLGPEMGNYVVATTTESKAGGKILGEPQEIPGIGLYVSFLDTEGNKVSLLQPSR